MVWIKNTRFSQAIVWFILLFSSLSVVITPAFSCEAPLKVCEWETRIVGIKTPIMIASGVKMLDGFILTNRHVAEDHKTVLTRDYRGVISQATVLPHSMPADLVVLRPDGLKGSPSKLEINSALASQVLYVVAFDQGRNGTRVYRESTFAHYPDTKKYPQARIHTNAAALPGNSGGAVVNDKGQLVGILASGDSRINEVIPAEHIEQTISYTGSQHSKTFRQQGRAIRLCADALDASSQITTNPSKPIVSKIERNCLFSGNKQLFDLAGQTFGKWWMFDLSEHFLKRSLDLDPNSPNTLMSLAVTYHLSRNAKKALPILKQYLRIDPSNQQALRLGIQTAGIEKDRQFADRVLSLMEKHNPAALPLAKSFTEDAFKN